MISEGRLPKEFLDYIESFLEQHRGITFPDPTRVYKAGEWRKEKYIKAPSTESEKEG